MATHLGEYDQELFQPSSCGLNCFQTEKWVKDKIGHAPYRPIHWSNRLRLQTCITFAAVIFSFCLIFLLQPYLDSRHQTLRRQHFDEMVSLTKDLSAEKAAAVYKMFFETIPNKSSDELKDLSTKLQNYYILSALFVIIIFACSIFYSVLKYRASLRYRQSVKTQLDGEKDAFKTDMLNAVLFQTDTNQNTYFNCIACQAVCLFLSTVYIFNPNWGLTATLFTLVETYLHGTKVWSLAAKAYAWWNS